MKKIYLTLLAIMFSVVVVTAGIISQFNIAPATISPVSPASPTLETISLDCDGTPQTVEVSEPDGKWDANDVESAIAINCSGTKTNIVMNGNTFQENKYGLRSFDETELKADECQKDGNSWDSEKSTCNEATQQAEL